MKFRTLIIENFGTIQSITLDLRNQGLVLITGLNKDAANANSNAAGKSLLLEAFCWCLWGKTIRDCDFKDDKVVRIQAGSDCCVTVKGTHNDKEVVIKRYRKHTKSKKPNDLEVYVNGLDISSSSIRDTQKIIDSIVNLPFEIFSVLMPGTGKVAAQMTDKDIKEVLETMLQVTDLQQAKETADQQLREVSNTLIADAATLKSLQDSLTNENRLLAQYTQYNSDYANQQSRRVEQVEAKLSEVNSSLKSFAERLLKLPELKAAIESNTKEVERSNNSITQAKTHITQQRQEYALHCSNVQSKKSELIGVLKSAQQSLNDLSNLGGACDVCLQDVTDDHKEQTTFRVSQSVNNTKEHIDKLDRELEVMLANHQLNLDNLCANINNMVGSHTSLVQSLDKLSNDLSSLKIVQVNYANKLEELKKLSTEKQSILEEVNTYEPLITQSQERVETLNKRIEKAVLDIKALERDQDYLSFWSKAFSTKGIRNYLLDNITPTLNKLVNHYCDILTNGEMTVEFGTTSTLKTGEHREKFTIDVAQKYGGDNYTSNSKGERQRANLAITFALADLAELHSNCVLDFKFLDEPFENIDEAGIESVVTLLQEQTARYGTVFVVTHSSYFKDMFPKELVIIKENSISRLG